MRYVMAQKSDEVRKKSVLSRLFHLNLGEIDNLLIMFALH